MQAGDAKKNIPLAIIAVLAVGFAITRVIPAPAPAQSAPRPETEKTTNTSGPPVSSTTTVEPLQVDPFSSIKLVRMPQKAGDEAHATSISETVRPVDPGAYAGLGTGLGSGLGGVTVMPDPSKKTAEGPPNDREDTGKKLALMLNGVIGAQAYITVDGAEAKGFSVGDVVAEGVRLTRIDNDSVTVMKDHKSVTLQMHVELSL